MANDESLSSKEGCFCRERNSMPASTSGFLRGLVISLIITGVLVGAAYRFFNLGGKELTHDESVTALVGETQKAIEAVSKRDLGKLRPASYDTILRPMDQLLFKAKEIIVSENYEPIADYQKIRACVDPVILFAEQAHAMAQKETSYLKKNYRFMEQKGEACEYLAVAMWNRLSTLAYNKKPNEDFVPAQEDTAQMLAVINNGLDADVENKRLWYMRGLVNRSSGAFSAAAVDLQKVIDLDPDFIPGLNDLGLVMINLKKFDKAEEYLEKAKSTSRELAQKAKVKPGIDYVTALFNLGKFHEGLTFHYAKENRTNPTPENQANFARHRDAAKKYFNEFLSASDPASPDVASVNALLMDLPE